MGADGRCGLARRTFCADSRLSKSCERSSASLSFPSFRTLNRANPAAVSKSSSIFVARCVAALRLRGCGDGRAVEWSLLAAAAATCVCPRQTLCGRPKCVLAPPTSPRPPAAPALFRWSSPPPACSLCCLEARVEMVRGPKKHMKRLNAPKHWMLDKLGGVFVRTPGHPPLLAPSALLPCQSRLPVAPPMAPSDVPHRWPAALEEGQRRAVDPTAHAAGAPCRALARPKPLTGPRRLPPRRHPSPPPAPTSSGSACPCS
jgi:hypothetical protein